MRHALTSPQEGKERCTQQNAQTVRCVSQERKRVCGESLESFLHDHDVIKMGPEFLEKKGNVLCVVQSTMRLTLGL